MAPRRLAAVAATVLSAAAAGGCGGLGATAGLPRPGARGEAAPAPSASQAPRERPWSLSAGNLRRAAVLAAAREARRRAAVRRLRRSRTVAGALRRALLAGHVTRAEHDRLRRDYVTARATVGRLPGLRRAELASVVGAVERLAADRRLTAGRFAAVFLILRRNTAFWTRSPSLPRPGDRTTFGRDPAVFQYYPGRGLQLQPLASWGRANAMAHACRRARRCPERSLRRTLDRLVALGARRGGFLAWEHYFAWGGGTPPWISGMTQGTAVQALARGGRVLAERRYRRAAERALGAFEQPPPVGVAVSAPGGRHYLMYSFSGGLRILNGDLQAVTGLRDMAALAHSRRARRLFRRGDRAARRAVAAFDTGAWSLYSARGRESTLGYHQLVGEFLGNLCGRTRARTYCAAERRFARYEHEPPRIQLAPLRGLHARRATWVRFSLSKVSRVAVRLSSKRGLSLRRDLQLPRGAHALTWTPPARGRYRLRIEAQGPSGPRGVELETLRVVLPKPKPKPKHGRPRERQLRTGGAEGPRARGGPPAAGRPARRRS